LVDPSFAACFPENLVGNLSCAVGQDLGSGKPFVCARFAGAFELHYGGVSGSINILLEKHPPSAIPCGTKWLSSPCR
jgi:hypothetical protein